MPSLQASIINKWKKTRVVFNEEQVLKWIPLKPNGDSAKEVLQWATEHPFLKVVKSTVPEAIVAGELMPLMFVCCIVCNYPVCWCVVAVFVVCMVCICCGMSLMFWMLLCCLSIRLLCSFV
jgi:hypothetical protein